MSANCTCWNCRASSWKPPPAYQAVAATILNVTEDHMDRYPFGLQQYRAAKLRIYENAKVCVVNADDALTMPIRGADERASALASTWATIT